MQLLKESASEATVTNTLGILGLIGSKLPLMNKEQALSLFKSLQIALSEESIVIVLEALNSILDVFADERSESLVNFILVIFMRFSPVLLRHTYAIPILVSQFGIIGNEAPSS